MDHPQGLERPWVTPKEREAKAAASRQAEAERKARFRLLKEAVRLEPLGLELEQRQQSGEQLSFMARTLLERWRKVRCVFDGRLPTDCP